MVTKVNDMDLRVLELFTKGYNKEYYIREVEKMLGVSSRTALKTLAKLEDLGILQSNIRGKIKLYKIKKSIISREYFLLTEQYKKIKFFEKNLIIKEIFEKIETLTSGIVLVFGSYAKGIPKKTSDLDLFVIGKYSDKKIKIFGKKYGIVINIKSYPMKIFRKELHDDFFLKEIIGNHVLIKSSEKFVDLVLKWTISNGV